MFLEGDKVSQLVDKACHCGVYSCVTSALIRGSTF